MEVHKKTENGVTSISIAGDLDASTMEELDRCIKDAIDRRQFKILVDCQELEFISSAGLGVFISYLDLLKQNDGNFVFYNMTDKVRNVFRLLGLEQIMEIVSNRDQAKARIDEKNL